MKKEIKEKIKSNSRKTDAVLWRDQIVFLEGINNLLLDLRKFSDTDRDKLSTSINNIKNERFVKSGIEWLQEGLVLSALQGGEATLNVNVMSLNEICEGIRCRIRELSHIEFVVERRMMIRKGKYKRNKR